MLSGTADAPDLIAMSDVLLLASRTESMTAVVIEAGMLRIPTASYAVGGVPEVVVDKVTGRLTRTGDVAGLATCVLELLEDATASQAMGEAARERYLSLFDIRDIAPKYLELYEQLVLS
jgi:glycosyltransferase involved in cell wall biosynthesis